MNGVLLLVGIGVVLLAAWLGGRPFFTLLKGFLVELSALRTAVEQQGVQPAVELERRLTAIEEGLDRLPSKWEDIKREAKSYYERARHHVRRTEAELEERGLRDPELADLSREFRLIHGDGGDPEGLPTVRPNVESDQPPTPPTEADWLTLANERKFGGH